MTTHEAQALAGSLLLAMANAKGADQINALVAYTLQEAYSRGFSDGFSDGLYQGGQYDDE